MSSGRHRIVSDIQETVRYNVTPSLHRRGTRDRPNRRSAVPIPWQRRAGSDSHLPQGEDQGSLRLAAWAAKKGEATFSCRPSHALDSTWTSHRVGSAIISSEQRFQVTMAATFGLESTLKKRGRPRNLPEKRFPSTARIERAQFIVRVLRARRAPGYSLRNSTGVSATWQVSVRPVPRRRSERSSDPGWPDRYRRRSPLTSHHRAARAHV